MTDISQGNNLLRCTVKKSADVCKKLGVGVFILVWGIILSSVVIVAASYIVSALAPLVSAVLAVLFNIPWYWYAGFAVAVSVPVYSFLWCVARELTKEDWKSKEAKDIAVILPLAAFTFSGVAIILALPVVAGAITIAAVIPLALFTLFDIKTILFPGAYLHYRGRMKKERGV